MIYDCLLFNEGNLEGLLNPLIIRLTQGSNADGVPLFLSIGLVGVEPKYYCSASLLFVIQ